MACDHAGCGVNEATETITEYHNVGTPQEVCSKTTIRTKRCACCGSGLSQSQSTVPC